MGYAVNVTNDSRSYLIVHIYAKTDAKITKPQWAKSNAVTNHVTRK